MEEPKDIVDEILDRYTSGEITINEAADKFIALIPFSKRFDTGAYVMITANYSDHPFQDGDVVKILAPVDDSLAFKSERNGVQHEIYQTEGTVVGSDKFENHFIRDRYTRSDTF